MYTYITTQLEHLKLLGTGPSNRLMLWAALVLVLYYVVSTLLPGGLDE